jgi:hypothetical protein
MAASLGVRQTNELIVSHQPVRTETKTTGEDTEDREDFICAAVNCRVCELAISP